MNEMIQIIKKYFYIKRKEVLILLGIEAVAILIGEIIMATAMLISPIEENYFQLGTTMSIVAMILIMFLLSVSSASDFNLMLSMGVIRKQFFVAKLFYDIVISIGCIFVIGTTYLVTGALHKVMYSFADTSDGGGVNALIKYGYIVLFICFLICISQIAALIFIKFKQVGFIILWVLWMVTFMGAPRAIHFIFDNGGNALENIIKNVLLCLNRYEGLGFGVLGIVVLAIVVFVSYKITLKQQVSM